MTTTLLLIIIVLLSISPSKLAYELLKEIQKRQDIERKYKELRDGYVEEAIKEHFKVWCDRSVSRMSQALQVLHNKYETL